LTLFRVKHMYQYTIYTGGGGRHNNFAQGTEYSGAGSGSHRSVSIPFEYRQATQFHGFLRHEPWLHSEIIGHFPPTFLIMSLRTVMSWNGQAQEYSITLSVLDSRLQEEALSSSPLVSFLSSFSVCPIFFHSSIMFSVLFLSFFHSCFYSTSYSSSRAAVSPPPPSSSSLFLYFFSTVLVPTSKQEFSSCRVLYSAAWGSATVA
jgi:hypothetical protein